MNLVLSTDAKPRLKWTAELHQRFVDAVNQLGGLEKATPKSLMKVMAIPGLTLYHLKSHLQKYRLGKSQQLVTDIKAKQETPFDTETREIQRTDGQLNRKTSDEHVRPINESLQIAQALQLQMEVQRKLHEQIEVQRHLQLRIEAQGKYLQSVLKKAHDTLTVYSSSSVGIELAKAELSKLVSMVNSGCSTSSCISDLTETETGAGSSPKWADKKLARSPVCSMDSSLTSSENSERKEGIVQKHGSSTNCVELALMEVQPQDLSNQSTSSNPGKKRNEKSVPDGICVDQQPSAKRCRTTTTTFDLNNEYENEARTSPRSIDLNCNGV
ncbi:unnamed protein product [Linum trigynum]